MTTLKELATKTGQQLRRLETQAAAHGFTGSTDDQLPEAIAAKLTGPKQLNSTPASEQSEPTQQQQQTSEGTGGVSDVYGASKASTKQAQKTRLEMETEAAEMRGKMEAHQLHMKFVAAKNAELRALADGETQAVAVDFEQSQISYLSGLEKTRTNELRALVAANHNSSSVSEMKKKILALNASMKF